MGRRRFLGSIDALIGARLGLKKRLDTDTLAKIDTLGTFSTDTLTGLGNLEFEGETFTPNSISISGADNNLFIEGTNDSGETKSYKVVIKAGILKLEEQ